jgi:uncharacterized membrane protein YkvA (DUF1232 family)
MQTSRIVELIERASQHERRTRTLGSLIQQFSQLRGIRPSPEQIASTVAFVEDYVRHAPALLELLAAAARRTGAAQEVAPVLDAAEQYFFAPLDLIPDQLGLVGLMDDAYLAHSLIHAASDRYRQRTGVPLLSLPAGLAQANQVIRALIGEPIASQLDLAVVGVLGMPAIQQALAQLPLMASPLPMGPDPIWGNMSISDRVNHQMGMLGIF